MSQPSHPPAVDVLTTSSRSRRVRPALIAILAALVLLVGGGVIVVTRMLSGGGAQPETAIPATALALVKVDLDPAAGQKVAALRLAARFPATVDASGAADLRRVVFDLARLGGQLANVDYATDVAPWLGQRGALALLPPRAGNDPIPVLALAVTDAQAATESLTRIRDRPPGAGADAGSGSSGPAQGPFGFVVGDHYVLIAPTQTDARDAASAAGQAPLAQDGRYRADVDALGRTGVAGTWLDLAGLGELAARSTSGLAASAAHAAQGSLAAVLRLDGTTVELAGRVFDVKAASTTGAVVDAAGTRDLLTTLPASTAIALAVRSADTFVSAALDQLAAAGSGAGTVAGDPLSALGRQFGLRLSEDAATVVGKDLVVAADAEGLRDAPAVGARVRTDPVAASAVLMRVQLALSVRAGKLVLLPYDETDDGYVVASTPAYLARLRRAGTLGDSARFTEAVPGAEDAVAVGYVDVGALVDRYGTSVGASEQTLANVKPLAALGVTVTKVGTNGGEFLVRLTTR